MRINIGRIPKGIILVPLWVVYSILYILLTAHENKVYSGLFALVVTTFFEIVIFGYAFWLWRHAIKTAKNVLGLFALSFGCMLIVNFVILLFFDVLHIPRSVVLGSFLSAFYNIPYLGFIVFQFFACALLLFTSNAKWKSRSLFHYFPVAAIICASLVLCIFLYEWVLSGRVAFTDFYTGVDGVLEMMSFVLVLLCLATAKNKTVFYLTLSYLIIIVIDITINFGMLSTKLGISDIVVKPIWFLGLMFRLYGLVLCKKLGLYQTESKNWLHPVNSIRSQIAFWVFAVALLAVAIFLSLDYLFLPKSFLDENTVQVLLSVLIIYSIITVVLSYIFAKKICTPLQRMEDAISGFMHSKKQADNFKKNEQNLSKLREFKKLEEFLLKAFAAIGEKTAAEKELVNLATQVAHDIRSPLAALQTTLKQTENIAEQPRDILRRAANRINDIANNLLTKYRQTKIPTSKIAPELIVNVIDNLLSEKRAQFADRNLNFEFSVANDAYGIFAAINLKTFKRTLSNIINNAVEASENNSKIVVELSNAHNNVKIAVIDRGKGITPELITKITQHGFSKGKSTGCGLGLSYAIEQIKNWNGKYTVKSKVGVGTSFIIELPKVAPPPWFQTAITITPATNVVILDDDKSIHDVLTAFFQGFNVNLVHCYNAKELTDYIKQNPDAKTLFLMDYEIIGAKQTGIDLIKDLNLAGKAILVTSHYEEANIRDACIKMGIGIIPKGFAPYVPIKVLNLSI
jgi:signal transduction histidine kinase